MEQSREVYETATNQLGSFLELVSNRLTLNKTGLDTPPPAPLSVLSERQRSGAQGHVSNVSSPSHGSRGGSGVRKRSESENNRRKSSTGHAGRPGSRPGSRYLLEDPSLSPSISCASSSLSECDRSSGKEIYKGDIKADKDQTVICSKSENTPWSADAVTAVLIK